MFLLYIWSLYVSYKVRLIFLSHKLYLLAALLFNLILSFTCVYIAYKLKTILSLFKVEILWMKISHIQIHLRIVVLYLQHIYIYIYMIVQQDACSNSMAWMMAPSAYKYYKLRFDHLRQQWDNNPSQFNKLICNLFFY
jgi:hypothetical protein